MKDNDPRPEREPRDSEEYYRLVFERSPQPSWIDDVETLAFLAVNEAAIETYGWTREEFLAMSLRDLRPPEDVPLPFDELGREGNTTLLSDERWSHRRKDGSLLLVQVRSLPLRFQGRSARLTQIIDVTQQVRVEEELRRQQELFEALIRSSLDGIIALDAQGRIQLWSPATERLTGAAAVRCLGAAAADVLEPLGMAETAASLGRALAGERVVGPRTTVRDPVSGREHDLEAQYSPLRDSGGSIRGALAIVRDVTEQQQLEAQLLQAQKVEAVGQLAGGVAHDFNNLLTAILGFCELAQLGAGEGSELAADLWEIRRAADRATALTRQLLAFSRKQVLQPQVLDPNGEVRELEPMLRRLLGEDVQLDTLLAPGLGSVRVDRAQLQQVIINLLVNARDAMPRGGRLIIETRNARLDEAYARVHAGAQAGSYVLIIVSDTGTGMTPEVQRRVFEPFFTTKERGKGTGLGLAMVYGVVKQSDGYIWVYSELGRGTTFKVYFPRVDAAAEDAEETSGEGQDLRGTETILVAEDEAVVRRLLTRLLTLQGYHVVEAESGGAALAAAACTPDIQLLITDVVMPDMSGRELADELLSLRTGLKVLYISGYTDESIASHGVLAPGLRLLEKPFTADVLGRRVRQILDGAE